jgi:hypothetical protein
MIKTLNSKNYPAGNRDYWWYNLSNPDSWITHGSVINLILYDASNEIKIATIILRLDKDDWFNRINHASRHIYGGREIIKIHIIKEYKNQQYYIYFGKIEDGVYPIVI